MPEYETSVTADCTLRLEDFTPAVNRRERPLAAPLELPDLIHGVKVTSLVRNGDHRGSLSVLFTTSAADALHPPHVYQVEAQPGSIRGWNYHRRQRDRLAFLLGDFQIALYDIRSDSPTRGRLNVFRAGQAWPIRLEIPSFVVHGVRNLGSTSSSFVNMPTHAYDWESPDKELLAYPDARVPFTFDEMELG